MKKTVLFLPLTLLFFSCASAQPLSDKELAVQTREKALSLKADVAVKDDFGTAQEAFNEADALEKSGNKDASAKYQESVWLFNAVFELAQYKRDIAQKELDKAKADIKKTEEDAAELDSLRRGGR